MQNDHNTQNGAGQPSSGKWLRTHRWYQ